MSPKSLISREVCVCRRWQPPLLFFDGKGNLEVWMKQGCGGEVINALCSSVCWSNSASLWRISLQKHWVDAVCHSGMVVLRKPRVIILHSFILFYLNVIFKLLEFCTTSLVSAFEIRRWKLLVKTNVPSADWSSELEPVFHIELFTELALVFHILYRSLRFLPMDTVCTTS